MLFMLLFHAWRKPWTVAFLSFTLFSSQHTFTQEPHAHDASGKLGDVHFPISCKLAVQQDFDRAVALLHSFAYLAAEPAFRDVARKDPECAMAHWGIAMTYFHELWQPPVPPPGDTTVPNKEAQEAQRLAVGTEREKKFIRAIAAMFPEDSAVPYASRLSNYEREMAGLGSDNPTDVESQVFYALALLAVASPADKTHAKQKQAAAILEPLYREYPQHPGMAHYLIHAYDNAELAERGVPMARAYSSIAPSVSHALHMPSHIFTRLGMWEDAIKSNSAARVAARQSGDVGEELHAMDYLVYAYLQAGRDAEAAQVIQQLKLMPNLTATDFKVGYAATAIPIRYMVERGSWADASAVVPPTQGPPHVIAIGFWAKGLGLARTGHAGDAAKQVAELQKLEDQLQQAGNAYWATQVRVMKREVLAWSAQAENKAEQAVSLLRQAADEEDALEKLPVTPGPIIPAREQLGDLLLQQKKWELAAKEFQVSNVNAPRRRGATLGGAEAAKRLRAGA
jgi:tetratricopeptide (TPR) repeat protein